VKKTGKSTIGWSLHRKGNKYVDFRLSKKRNSINFILEEIELKRLFITLLKRGLFVLTNENPKFEPTYEKPGDTIFLETQIEHKNLLLFTATRHCIQYWETQGAKKNRGLYFYTKLKNNSAGN